jgi:hypothetical protein
MGRGGGGDFSELRDTFVSYLLSIIVERVKGQKRVMLQVSNTLTQIGRSLMKNDYGSKMQVKIRLAQLTEAKIINAISAISGDEDSMMYFIHCCNELSYQLMRPSPRMMRTQQKFNDVVISWRIACGRHFYGWESILQMNSAIILQEVPLIKAKGTGLNEFMARMKSMASKNENTEEKKK